MSIFNYLGNIFFNHEIIYVDSFKKLVEVTDFLKFEGSIALDTEFTWKSTYYPSLDLIQIAANNKIFIIDSLKIEDLMPLAPILESKKIKKIFHSMKGDLSALKTKFNINFSNIRDTQIAEFILENNSNLQISYKGLVSKYFLINLPKTETNSNWSKRPLEQKQINYASDDVKFLKKICQDQENHLRNKKLFNKYLEYCENEKILSLTDFSQLRMQRLIKKNKKISNLEKNIFMWRENAAKKLNVTPNKIFNEKHLSILKSVVMNKKYDECQWIIKDNSLRLNFLASFK